MAMSLSGSAGAMAQTSASRGGRWAMAVFLALALFRVVLMGKLRKG